MVTACYALCAMIILECAMAIRVFNVGILDKAIQVDFRSLSDMSDSGAQNVDNVFSGQNLQAVGFHSNLMHYYPMMISGKDKNASVGLTKFNNAEHPLLLKPARNSMRPSVWKPVQEFIRDAEAQAVSMKIVLTYKVARCGSTLLENMLANDPRFLLITEPLAFASAHEISDAQLRQRLLRALVLHLAVPLTAEQRIVFIDFNSQVSHYMLDLVEAMPEAHHSFIYRNTMEVADSLYRKPPGWLGHRPNVPGIKAHLEASVHSLDTSVTGGIQDSHVKVLWYQHILDGHALHWVLNATLPNLTQQETDFTIGKMPEAKQQNSQTGDSWSDKSDHMELSAHEKLKDSKENLWYNPELIRFRVQHHPTAVYTNLMPRIKELFWPEDAAEIQEHLSLGGKLNNQPVIVRNALASTGLASSKPGENYVNICENLRPEGVIVLRAHRLENQFIWHPSEIMRKWSSVYEVYAKWERIGNCEQWKHDPQLYIVDGCPANISKQLLTSDSVMKQLPEHSPRDRDMSLRISHAGAVTALHIDNSDSMLMQLAGTKSLILYPETEVDNLYIYDKTHPMYRRALADPEYPDEQMLPNFRVTAGFFGEVKFGDLAYWPGRWAHYIHTTEGPSVSIGKRAYNSMRATNDIHWAEPDVIAKVEASRYAKGRSINSHHKILAKAMQGEMPSDDDEFGATSDGQILS